ncbi:MAG: cytochrome c [Campylobacterales bacterium]|nr:cytochrome c [Campylobacterales bacterium]
MKQILILLTPVLLMSGGSFITQKEYAAQLYKNPRGIGCQLCHGEKGEGRVIANYVHKKKEKSFVGPAINNLDFQTFYKALNVRKNAMPRYFLTDEEIEALYLHIHQNESIKMGEEENVSRSSKSL